MGRRTVTGHGRRRRHAAQGAETSGGGLHVEGVGDVQVDGALFQERRWGAGERERGYKEKFYWSGSGRIEGGNENIHKTG